MSGCSSLVFSQIFLIYFTPYPNVVKCIMNMSEKRK